VIVLEAAVIMGVVVMVIVPVTMSVLVVMIVIMAMMVMIARQEFGLDVENTVEIEGVAPQHLRQRKRDYDGRRGDRNIGQTADREECQPGQCHRRNS